MNPKNRVRLEQLLSKITEFEGLLDSTLDNSLTNPFIDSNRYVKQYNDYLREILSLLDDEDIVDILTEMSPYAYTGDDRIDVMNTKQRLVEVYLKTRQLTAYLQALLELE